jgi:hypothetical protein
VNTPAAVNAVDVGGSQVIGAGYAGATVAPANGLLVQGELGVGYTTNPGTYQLYVNGNTWTSGVYSFSDMRWKEHVEPLTDAVAKVMQLRPVSYDFVKDSKLHFPKGHQIGFIAQELEKVVPEVVTTNNDGYKGVAYQNLTALLAQAVKDQQGEITRLNTQIEQLQAAIIRLGGTITPAASTSVEGQPDLK